MNSLKMQGHLKAALDQSFDEHAMNAMESFLSAQIDALEAQRDLLIAQRNVWRTRGTELLQERERQDRATS